MISRLRFPPLAAAIALCAATACATLRAQDLEPRAYSNAPVGLNFAIGNYAYSKGRVLTDPASSIDNVRIEARNEALALATTLDVFGKSAKFDMAEPYTALDVKGNVFGVPRRRYAAGFSDPLFRFSINFYGAPALKLKDFANYKQDLIVGASLRVGAPLGQYNPNNLVNVGANRWSVRPELGFSKAIGKITAELASGATLFTDNENYLGGHTRQQAPLFSTQADVSYSFASNCWLAVNAAYYTGGRTAVDGVKSNDEQEGVRVGATLALPINKLYSVKIYAIKGFNARRGPELSVAGAALQYRWGGGL